jgi:ELWxxDGT repeat protein
MVKDIAPCRQPIFDNPCNSSPNQFTSSGDILFFAADDKIHGRALWKSDGTTAGTVLIHEAEPEWLTIVNQTLFYVVAVGAVRTLWRVDVMGGAPVAVAQISAASLVNFNGVLFFAADDGAGYGLWKSDGTTAGTLLVKRFAPYRTDIRLPSLTAVGDALYISADDGIHGAEPWRSDGTEAGTYLISDILPGPSESLPDAFTLYRRSSHQVLFAASDSTGHRGLWLTDGTAAGTLLVQVASGNTGVYSSTVSTIVGSRAYFATDYDAYGAALWALMGADSDFDHWLPLIRLRSS